MLIDHMINAEGRREWRQDWRVVAASMFGYAASVIHLYSLGVMIVPLEKEFGWSRAVITSGYTIVSVVVFLFSTLLGMTIDRFGPRRIALSGIVLYCLSIALLSLTGPAVWTWWLLWLLLAFGVLLLKPTVWVAAISSLFNSSRGLALAVALSASGLISSGAPLLTHFLVDSFGWRTAYLLWALITGATVFPILFLFFSSARDKRRKASGLASTSPAPARSSTSIRPYLKSAVFLKLAIASAIVSMLFTAMIVSLVPMMTSSGIGAASAAGIAGIVGISQIVGRLASGFLLDRFDARRVTAIVVCFPVMTCLILLLLGGSVPFAIVAALLFGLSVGAELDAIAYLASRFFGTDNFGALFGTIMSLTALGGGLGPFLASLTYDFTGSYAFVQWTIIPLSLGSAYLLLTLGAYPEASRRQIEEAPAS